MATYALEEFIASIFREEEQELLFCHEDEGDYIPSRHRWISARFIWYHIPEDSNLHSITLYLYEQNSDA